MAGIYLHIPFCKQACHYCNFHFSTSYEKYRDQMLNALVKQLIHDAPLLPSEVNTIYFGGGTPSLLSKSELNNLITTIKMNYKVSQHVEVTLEANPDDVTITKASDWFAAGVNRLSIGVQSFYQEHLSTMNRAHDAKEAENAIHIIKEVGFTNYSVDLMFALPGLTDQMWLKNLQKVIDLKVPHLSCYNLTIEEQTALSKLISKNEIPSLSENTSIRQFSIAMDTLKKSGYQQYEISNYCLTGMESRHNKAYWEQKEYLGIGPAAHSLLARERTFNVAHNMHYIRAIENNLFKKEIEIRTPENRFNEYIMTRLRTKNGIEVNDLELNHHGYFKRIKSSLDEQINLGSITFEHDLIKLTRKGKFIADQVALALFV